VHRVLLTSVVETLSSSAVVMSDEISVFVSV
jgi:hypothetical protein